MFLLLLRFQPAYLSNRKSGKGKKGGRGRPKKMAKDEEEEEDDEVILLEHILPRAGPSTGRMTLILIEEVDLVFDGKL